MLLETHSLSRPSPAKRRARGDPTIAQWLPLVILPIVVLVVLPPKAPRWCLMWLLAGTIYIGCKWLSWASSSSLAAPLWQKVAWWLAWPGMDANRFFAANSPHDRATMHELASAAIKTIIGGGLFVWAGRLIAQESQAAGAWLAMAAFILTLHCGLFHLLSCLWRAVGFSAQPLMNRPLASRSVAEFWGRRWNRAFRDLTYPAIFRPLATRYDPAIGAVSVFAFSGLVHELVISVPAGGGFGLPTLYFLLQGVAVLAESRFIKNPATSGRAFLGRAIAAVVIAAPLPLLFHPPFVSSVVVPFLKAIGP